MTDAPSSPPPSSNSNAPAFHRQLSKDPPGSYRSNTSYGRQFQFVPDDISVELNLWQQGESQRKAASVLDRLEKIRNSAIPKLDKVKEENSKTTTSTGVGKVDDFAAGKNENDEPKKTIISTINKEEIPIKDNKNTTRKNNDIEIDVDDLYASAELDVDDWAEILNQSIRDEDERRNNANANANTASVTNDTSSAEKEMEEGSALSAPLALLNLEREPDTQQPSDNIMEAINLEAAHCGISTMSSDESQPLGREKSDLETQKSCDETDIAEEATKMSHFTSSQEAKDIDTNDNRAAPDSALAQSIMQNASSDTLRQGLRKQADTYVTNANANADREDEKKVEGLVPADGYDIGNRDINELELHQKMLARQRAEPKPNPHAIAQSQLNIGSVYDKQGNGDKAYEYYSKALAGFLETVGENHEDTATCYANMGAGLVSRRKIDEGLAYQRKALAIFETIHGGNHRATASCHYNIGVALESLGGDYNLSLALEEYRKSLHFREALLGEHHPDTVECYGAIARVCLNRRDLDGAFENQQKVVNIHEAIYGFDSIITAWAYDGLGEMLLSKGDFDGALEKHHASLSIHKASGRSVAVPCDNIGSVYLTMNDFDEALVWYEKAADSATTDEYRQAGLFKRIGRVQQQKGNFESALVSFQKSLGKLEVILKDDHPDLAKINSMIGQLLLLNMGQADLGMEYMSKARAIFEAAYGEAHFAEMNVALCFATAVSLKQKNDHDKALEFFGDALSSFERVDTKHDKLVALATQSCKDSASMLLEAGNIVNAKQMCQKWLEIVQNCFGPKSKEVAQFYLEQGRLVIQAGNPRGALESYKKSIELFQSLPGESARVEVAQCTWNIGGAHNAMGEKSRALVVFNECLKMEESLMGEHHESLAETYRTIFNLSRELGDKWESVHSGMKALVILKLHLGGDHPSTVEAHQELLSYLDEAGMSVMDLDSFALTGKLSLDDIQFAFSSNGLDDDNDNDGKEDEDEEPGVEEESQEVASGNEEADGDDTDEENIIIANDNDEVEGTSSRPRTGRLAH